MDPITATIIAAVSAGITESFGDVAKKTITDAYEGLKALIKSKFGGESPVAKAVDQFEETPDSKKRVEELQKEIGAAKADQDPELQQTAKALLEQIRHLPGGEQHLQQAIGSYIAQADRGGTASVNVNMLGKPRG